MDALLAKSKDLQQLASNEIKRVQTLAIEASTPKHADNITTPGATESTTTTDPGGIYRYYYDYRYQWCIN